MDTSHRVATEEALVGLSHTVDSLLSNRQGRATEMDPGKGRIIQFVGSREGEGTSTLARAYARISAERLGRSVLLLNTVDEIDQDQTRQVISLVERGSPQREASLTLHHVAKLADVAVWFEQLRELFALILIDSPPATVSSEGFTIARRIDGIFLVVEADRTPWPVVNDVKKWIDNAGGNILGIIFNKRRYHMPRAIYSRF